MVSNIDELIGRLTGGTPSVSPQGGVPISQPTTTNTFQSAFSRIIGEEGGYVNNPADPGGETKFGIAKRFNPDVDIKNLTVEGAQKIYKTQYWDKYGLDSIAPEQASDVFSMIINSPSRAAKAIQKVVGAKQDGAIGPNTRKLMNSYTGDLGKEARKEYLVGLAKDKAGGSNWKAHANGWANRYLDSNSFGTPTKKAPNKIDLRNKSSQEILTIIKNIG